MTDERPAPKADAPAAPAPVEPPRDPTRRLRAHHLVLLGLILLLATGLRLYKLGAQAFWADELLSLEQSAGWGFAHEDVPGGVVLEQLPDHTTLKAARPWPAIWTSLEEDAHPPLYLVLLRGWREGVAPLGGDPEAGARGLSVVASLVAIALLFDVMWRLHGTRYGAAPALWGCLLMALAGPQIQFAQEARSYALLTAFGLGACAALVRLERDGPGWGRAAALGTGVLAMVLTHYAALGAVLAVAAYVALRLRGRALRQAGAALVLAAAVFAIAWGPFLRAQHLEQTKPAWRTYPDDALLDNTLERLAMLPVRFLNEPMRSSRQVVLLAAGGYLACLLMLRRRPDLLLWVLWAGGVIATAAAVDLLRSSDYLQVLRYTLLAAPAVYALAAALLAHVRLGAMRHAFPAVAVLSCVISLPRAYAYYTPPKPDWEKLASDLRVLGGPDDGIVFYGSPDEADALRALAIGYARYLRPSPRPFVFLSGPPSERVLERLRQTSGIWIVSHRDPYEIVSLFPTFAPDRAIPDPHLPMMYRMVPTDAPTATAPARLGNPTTGSGG